MLNFETSSTKPPKRSVVEEFLDRDGAPERVIDRLKRESRTHPIDSRLNLQVFLNSLGREEESFAVSIELMQMAPYDPRVLFNHGWHWLKRGELQKGLAFLEYGRELNTYGNAKFDSVRPKWHLPDGKGHRVLLLLEGGLGDEIIHFRFGKELVERHGCHVTVICHPSLAPVFAKQRWVSAVAQREAALGIYHDSWLPGMSAALELGFEYPDLSGEKYLEADPLHLKKWSELLGPKRGKIRVGLRWSGNPNFEHQQLRRFPPELLLDLARFQQAEFFSFQRDDGLVDLPPEVVDLGPGLKTWEDTAAALEQMDLVITSCTSVAHMSAALGKKTWVVVPALAYFPWAIPGRGSPWYQAVRLFRQASFGSWQNVREMLDLEFSQLLESS